MLVTMALACNNSNKRDEGIYLTLLLQVKLMLLTSLVSMAMILTEQHSTPTVDLSTSSVVQAFLMLRYTGSSLMVQELGLTTAIFVKGIFRMAQLSSRLAMRGV